jgi:hypothetical protein
VVKVAAVYLVVAWAMVQVADVSALHLPAWTVTLVRRWCSWVSDCVDAGVGV